MISFVAFSALLAVTAASLEPAYFAAQSPVRSQYHSQDGLGQYNYGYNGDLSSKTESRAVDGVTRGSYSYVDANGRLQTVQYTADDVNGFRALATNLPNAPADNSHAALVAGAPEPVRDTPEVAQAKIEHARAFNEAAARAAAAPEYPVPVVGFSPVAPIAPAPLLAVRAEPTTSFSYSVGESLPAVPRAQFFHAGPAFAPIAPVAIVPGRADPIDTPEVAAARAEHFAAVERQKALLASAH